MNTKTNTDTYTGTDIDNDTNANIALDYKLPKNWKLKNKNTKSQNWKLKIGKYKPKAKS